MSDLIDRQAAIDAVDYWHGIDASEALSRLPSAQPEIIRCKECIRHGVCRYEQLLGLNGYCSQAERRTDGTLN